MRLYRSKNNNNKKANWHYPEDGLWGWDVVCICLSYRLGESKCILIYIWKCPIHTKQLFLNVQKKVCLCVVAAAQLHLSVQFFHLTRVSPQCLCDSVHESYLFHTICTPDRWLLGVIDHALRDLNNLSVQNRNQRSMKQLKYTFKMETFHNPILS